MKNKPKSCPWCHGRAFIEFNGEKWRVWHDCERFYGIHIVTDWAKTERDAIGAWNNRMVDNDIAGLKINNMKLRQYVEKCKEEYESMRNYSKQTEEQEKLASAENKELKSILFVVWLAYTQHHELKPEYIKKLANILEKYGMMKGLDDD